MTVIMISRKWFAVFFLIITASLTIQRADVFRLTKYKLGNHALIPTRSRAPMDSEHCFQNPLMFMKKVPPHAQHNLRPRDMAKLWMSYHKEGLNITFFGPERTIAVFQEGKSLNALIDVDYSVQRFILRNSLTGQLHLLYENEEKILTRLASNYTWTYMDILDCQCIPFYLSKTFGAYKTSFILVRRNSSEDEDNFISFTGGLAGFYRN